VQSGAGDMDGAAARERDLLVSGGSQAKVQVERWQEQAMEANAAGTGKQFASREMSGYERAGRRSFTGLPIIITGGKRWARTNEYRTSGRRKWWTPASRQKPFSREEAAFTAPRKGLASLASNY